MAFLVLEEAGRFTIDQNDKPVIAKIVQNAEGIQVDIRKQYKDKKGEYQPSKNGITLDSASLDGLAVLIASAKPVLQKHLK